MIRNLYIRKTFRIFGRPLEAVRDDYKVSRRDGFISTGRVRPKVDKGSNGGDWERGRERGGFGPSNAPQYRPLQ